MASSSICVLVNASVYWPYTCGPRALAISIEFKAARPVEAMFVVMRTVAPIIPSLARPWRFSTLFSALVILPFYLDDLRRG